MSKEHVSISQKVLLKAQEMVASRLKQPEKIDFSGYRGMQDYSLGEYGVADLRPTPGQQVERLRNTECQKVTKLTARTGLQVGARRTLQ